MTITTPEPDPSAATRASTSSRSVAALEAELLRLELSHVVHPWTTQADRSPTFIQRAAGVYLFDIHGRQILDLSSGLFNVNIGYDNAHVRAAMHAQIDETSYISPGLGSPVRARLASEIAARTPGDLNHVFFTNSGAEAVEAAVRAARLYTGRQKVYSTWQGFHGATAGALSMSGDPRRLGAEPGIPGQVKFLGPNCYRCPWGAEGPSGCSFACFQSLKSQLVLDGPETVAAVILEPVVGSNGVIVPPPSYLPAVRELCNQFGIVLIFDETATAWGRTGRWFAADHFGVIPDVIVTAKGLTSGYAPLGVTVWSDTIHKHFQSNPFLSGSTMGGHAVCCAAGLATLEVYEREDLIARAADMGEHLRMRLEELARRHPSVGDMRCIGMWGCLELTSSREARAPLAGYRDQRGNISAEITARLLSAGVHTLAKWDYVHIAPPLVISGDELEQGLEKLDGVLDWVDTRLPARRINGTSWHSSDV